MTHLYCDLIEFNERFILENSDEKSTLLVLNDDCLIHIFRYLKISDYVNLAKTCGRLLNVAISGSKFSEVVVNRPSTNLLTFVSYNDKNLLKNETFVTYNDVPDIFSVVGRKLLAIELYDGDDFILKTISDNCWNLKSIKLQDFNGALNLNDFKHLKELKICNCSIKASELKSFFENNTEIESLQIGRFYSPIYSKSDVSRSVQGRIYANDEVNVMELLQMIPQLKRLDFSLINYQQVQHVLNLDGLTKLKFYNRVQDGKFVNNFLKKLATKVNLVELDFNTIKFEDTFVILKSFRNLEVLSVSCGLNWCTLPENTIFPPKLKYIKLSAFLMTCSNFVSIVKQTTFLEEFNLDNAKLIWESFFDDSTYSTDYQILDRIVEQLKHRTLKIIYPNRRREVKTTYLYNSDHFKIISLGREEDPEKEQPNKIILKYAPTETE